MKTLALALLLIPAFGFSQVIADSAFAFSHAILIGKQKTAKEEDEAFRYFRNPYYNFVLSQKKAYNVKSAIFPAVFGVAAGMAPNTSWGRAIKDGSLYGCAISITIGERKPIEHYFFNFCVSGAGFLAGRGIRAIADSK